MKVPLPYATDNTIELIGTAIAGLDSISQEGCRYNKGGVMVGGLIPVSERQASLLDPSDRDRVAGLMVALYIQLALNSDASHCLEAAVIHAQGTN